MYKDDKEIKKNEERINALIKSLTHFNPADQKLLIEEMVELNDKRAVEPLILALGVSDKEVRIAASKALRKLGEDKWGEVIKGDLADFYRLGELNDLRVIKPLIKGLDSYDVDVCKLAVSGLAKQKNVHAVEPLIKAVNVFGSFTNAPDVRKEIIQALGELGDVRAVEPLLKVLNEYDEHLSKEAARSLVLLVKANPSLVKLDRKVVKLIRNKGISM
jgi:HEAT repeat protein